MRAKRYDHHHCTCGRNASSTGLGHDVTCPDNEEIPVTPPPAARPSPYPTETGASGHTMCPMCPECIMRFQALREANTALRNALHWALDYIADDCEEDGTPVHSCEFTTNPLKGACDLHENYWSAKAVLAGETPT